MTRTIVHILKYCLNIKSISFVWNNSIDTSWLHHKYPTLEHLNVFGNIATETKDDWKLFFQLNPNIRSFECKADFLVEKQDWLLTTIATFDYLAIHYHGGMNTNRVCSLVKRLYERGFHKKLRLKLLVVKQNVIDEMCKLPAIERLTDSLSYEKVDFPVMADVKELHCFWNWNHINVESISKFPNVERIEFGELKLNQLFVLIGQFKTLKQLRLLYYNNEKIKLLNL